MMFAKKSFEFDGTTKEFAQKNGLDRVLLYQWRNFYKTKRCMPCRQVCHQKNSNTPIRVIFWTTFVGVMLYMIINALYFV